jgi:hypothetical protein
MNQTFFDDLSNEALERLNHAVSSLPAPGEGFNPGLLPCAYAAMNCGYTEDEFVWIIKANVKAGAREVVDAELRRAFKRCYMGSKVEALPARRLPWDKVGLAKIVAAGKESGGMVVGVPVAAGRGADGAPVGGDVHAAGQGLDWDCGEDAADLWSDSAVDGVGAAGAARDAAEVLGPPDCQSADGGDGEVEGGEGLEPLR